MQIFQTKLKELWEKIKGFFKKLNKKIRILLGVCLVVILAVIIAVAVQLNRTDYELLQGGLNASEISNLVQFLTNNGVTQYKIDGDRVLVPEGRADQLKAQLALSGNLNSGFLYEYWTDNITGISTQNEQDQAWLIAKEQKLEAVIGQFEGVMKADVVITPETEKIYVLDPQATPAAATVVITPSTMNGLSDNVVKAIRNTVRYGVEGLDISNISIEDIYGNPYSDNSTIAQSNQATALKMQYEEQISNTVRREVLQTLGPIYGYDNVNVSVLCTVDVSRKYIDRTDYEQPVGSVIGGGLIINDRVFIERIQGEGAEVGGAVGTTTNSDLNGNFPNYPDINQDLGDGEGYLGEDIQRTGVVNQITQQEEVLEGRLTNLRINVTVNQNCQNAGAMTIDALRDSVANMAGISGTEDALNRVFVAIAPFDKDNAVVSDGTGVWFLSPENSWILYAAIGGLVLFLVLLIVILMLARRRRKKRMAEQQALEEEMLAAQAAAEAAAIIAAAPPTGGADIMEVNTEKSMELRKSVRQFAQNNPEIAAQMVRAWLKGDETGGGS